MLFRGDVWNFVGSVTVAAKIYEDFLQIVQCNLQILVLLFHINLELVILLINAFLLNY